MNAKYPDDWNEAKPAILPEPTYWPVTLALASTMLLWGILTTWIISGAGLALFIVSLSGWIRDMLQERRKEGDL